MQMIRAGLPKLRNQLPTDGGGATRATNFSVGANLMIVLLAAQDGEWMSSTSQCAVPADEHGAKYAPKPVVAAQFGMALAEGASCRCTARLPPAQTKLLYGSGESGRWRDSGRGNCNVSAARAT